MPRVQHVDKKETPSPADDDWKFYFCQDFTSCPGVRRSWRVGVQWCAGLYTVQCMKTLWAHIYGHHVHMAVNHTCGPLNPYVHFIRHVRHFQSQIWSMLRLPQWWRLRRLQLRLIRGGPVDDKILKQNRKRQRSKICGKKKWSCFKSCLDVSYMHTGVTCTSWFQVKNRLGEAWAQGALGTFTGGARKNTWPVFLVLAFLVRRQSMYVVTSTPKAISAPRMVLLG